MISKARLAEELIKDSQRIAQSELPKNLALLLYADAVVNYASKSYVNDHKPTKKGSE